MQTAIQYRKGSCLSGAKNFCASIMWREASYRNAQEKIYNFSRQNSRKLCNSSEQNCVVPVLLHLLQRRCVSPPASGNLALHNEPFCLERVVNFLDLAPKSGDISRTVCATTKVKPTVSIRAIAELENTQKTFSKRLPSAKTDVKKYYRCSS